MISYEFFDGLGVFIFCYVTVGLRDKLDMHPVWWKIWFLCFNTVYFESTEVTNQQYIHPQDPCLCFVFDVLVCFSNVASRSKTQTHDDIGYWILAGVTSWIIRCLNFIDGFIEK